MSLPAYVLYRMYDADDRLLYIGVTASATQRLLAHRRKPWWTDVVDVKLQHLGVMTRTLAMGIEARAIRDENPLHNINRQAVKS